jgi:hypothetical protein
VIDRESADGLEAVEALRDALLRFHERALLIGTKREKALSAFLALCNAAAPPETRLH